MSRNAKLTLMFAPFLLFFGGFIAVVSDLKHPAVSRDQCIVTAVGQDAQKDGVGGSFIYRQSENRLHDVRLRCNRLGSLLLNDTQLFVTPVKSGQAAKVSLQQYRLWPDRWTVSVYTGKPAD